MADNGFAGGTPSAKGAGRGTGGGKDITSLGAGAGGDGKKQKIRTSRSKPIPGLYSVKEYVVTEDILDSIGTLRTSVTFWSSIGSLGLGFVLSTYQSLALAGDEADIAANATWWAYLSVGAFVTFVSYAAALVYFIKGKSVLQFVKDHTKHEEY